MSLTWTGVLVRHERRPWRNRRTCTRNKAPSLLRHKKKSLRRRRTGRETRRSYYLLRHEERAKKQSEIERKRKDSAGRLANLIRKSRQLLPLAQTLIELLSLRERLCNASARGRSSLRLMMERPRYTLIQGEKRSTRPPPQFLYTSLIWPSHVSIRINTHR